MSRPTDDTSDRVTAPTWWAELQSEFGRLLRSPLEAHAGGFRSRAGEHRLHARIHDDGPGAAARLTLYHEQYWMRLFHTLQQAFPRVTWLVGPFTFNRIASAHLQAHPPTGPDLADAGAALFPALKAVLDTFVDVDARGRAPRGVVVAPLASLAARAAASPETQSIQGLLAELAVPWSLLLQALTLDEAERRAFLAPALPAWQPTDDDVVALRDSRARVRFAPSFSLVRIDWPIAGPPPDPPSCNLTTNAGGQRASAGPPPALPARLRVAEHHVVVARGGGVARTAVDPVFARLLARLRTEPLADAVSHIETHIETHSPAAAASHVHASLDRFLTAAAAAGWWVGLDAVAPSTAQDHR